jgi:hypothetical protein
MFEKMFEKRRKKKWKKWTHLKSLLADLIAAILVHLRVVKSNFSPEATAKFG